jgi:hypothetical protein
MLTTGNFKSSGRTSIRDRPKVTLYTIDENVVKRNIVRMSFGRVLGVYGYGKINNYDAERKEEAHEFC